MKRTMKLVFLAVINLMLTGYSTWAQAEPQDPSLGTPSGGPPHGVPALAMVLVALLDKYDVNKDGQLDQNELAALKKDLAEGKFAPPPRPGGLRGPGGPPPLPREILDKYDTNHDGVLDETERAALRKDVQEGKIQLPPGLGPRGPGGPLPTVKEILEKYDADHDGKLDETELAAFLKDLHLHRPPPFGPGGPPPFGPGGPPPIGPGGPRPGGPAFGGPPPEAQQQ